MRVSEGVNWHLGYSSRNAEAVKKAKSALKHIFFRNLQILMQCVWDIQERIKLFVRWKKYNRVRLGSVGNCA